MPHPHQVLTLRVGESPLDLLLAESSMARMNWGKTEVARRAARYGTTVTDSVVSPNVIEKSKTAKSGSEFRGKRKKKSRKRQSTASSGKIRSWTAPTRDDPFAVAKKRLTQYEQELAKNAKENRRLNNFLQRNVKEKNKIEASIEQLKRLLEQNK